MGDRVSIQLMNGSDKSVVLFSHWGGRSFLSVFQQYYNGLQKEIKKGSNSSMPIGRLEPETVMVDFIRYYTRNMDRVSGGLYLGVDENDGDNSDNGHWVFDLVSGSWRA